VQKNQGEQLCLQDEIHSAKMHRSPGARGPTFLVDTRRLLPQYQPDSGRLVRT
jgi:hypothetical protein